MRILQWVVSIEAYSAPTGSSACAEMNCYLFHMAVKPAKRARWLQVRNYLDEKFGIKVNFTEMMNVHLQKKRGATRLGGLALQHS